MYPSKEEKKKKVKKKESDCVSLPPSSAMEAVEESRE
jgi:hypothetical protein